MRFGVCAALAGALVLAPSAPATFPGGNGKLLVVAYSQREHEVFVLAPDGSGRVSLTNDFRGEIGVARWSPDGNRIAFLRYAFAPNDGETPSRWSLWVMNADGSGKHRLRRFLGFYPTPDHRGTLA